MLDFAPTDREKRIFLFRELPWLPLSLSVFLSFIIRSCHFLLLSFLRRIPVSCVSHQERAQPKPKKACRRLKMAPKKNSHFLLCTCLFVIWWLFNTGGNDWSLFSFFSDSLGGEREVRGTWTSTTSPGQYLRQQKMTASLCCISWQSR